ncbi:uncharacterized protein [Solanum tuberosum]|uniref:uncharacterized protein n=1 Tax=Solanum tuberosum TaxID=4113 RepID=UPI00073A3CBF|nr:PREDICTED: uncharacterized protein LOC107061293 [Solanum tuberosum]
MAPGNSSADLPQNDSAPPVPQTNSSVQGQGIDYNHPLFLNPTDVSGISLISFQLLGIGNYMLWSRSIRLALLGRNKLGLIDGTVKKEMYSVELWGHWERVNAIVLSWLLNSVSKELLSGLAFASSAFDVWTDLRERFDRVDGSRTYSLHKDIASMQQGTTSVSEYYTRLKTLWDEFEILVPAPCCNCEVSKGFVTHMNRQKVYQFLMGLNESYQQARSQILMLDPLPTINHVYSMIVGDECQKAVVKCTTSLGMTSISSDPSVAMYSRAGSSSGVSNSTGVNQKFKRNSILICDFCKCKGHSKEFCYKVVGYPPDFKSKRKVQGGSISPPGNHSNQYSSAQANFTYGLNTNIPPPGWGTPQQHSSEGSNVNLKISKAEKEVQQMLQGCTFTKDQYDHILKMVQQKSESPTVSTCNTASTTGKDSFVVDHSQVWIIDTGATNHMVSSLDMMVKGSVSKLPELKPVYLPNGTTTQVSHVGSCALSARSIITNALHVPAFKYNLLSVSQITKELGCSVTFFPNFCVFQELYSGKVKEVGKEEGGLYLLKLHLTKTNASTSSEREVAFAVNNTKPVDMELWHQRLGHVSSTVLARLFAVNQQNLCTLSKCSVYPYAKQTRLAFPIWVVCIKDHVLTPQQNGVAERKHRHLLEVTRALRFQASIPVSYWGQCVLAAAYLINRLPSSVLGYETPYERLYGRKPVLTHLKTIGCLCYAKQLTEHDKLLPRSRSAVLMGYSEIQKGYILLDLSNRSFFISRDVLFREDQFPFAQMSSPIEKVFPDSMHDSAVLPPRLDHMLTSYVPASTCPSDAQQEESELPLCHALPVPEVDTGVIASDSDDATSRMPSVRRSSRPKQSLLWLKDFVSCTLNNPVPYSLCNYMSYDHLSSPYQAYIAATSIIREPDTYSEAVTDKRWVDAMQSEIQALESNNTWVITDLPQGKRAIGCRWIYKVKYKSTGEVERFKARLVAKGYSQQEGIDYKETFSPVVKMVTVRTIVALAASRQWHIHQMDVFNAFLHGELDDEIYMQLPQGFVSQREKVCRLTKSLYGLKQAPRQWNHKLIEALLKLKFQQSQHDHSLFINKAEEGIIIILVYVDDMLITGSSLKLIEDTKRALQQAFKMKDLGELKYFLGIEFTRSTVGILMHQRKYALELISEVGMTAAKPAGTPIDINVKLTSKLYDEHVKK